MIETSSFNVQFYNIYEGGILCIEVKGGKISKEEKWISKNKRGDRFTIQNPFWQAHECMKAIERTLLETYEKGSIESDCCVGCAVVFPECIADCRGDGVIKQVMFDNRNELSEFGGFLRESLKYWSDEKYIKQSRCYKPLTKQSLEKIVTLFKADFGAKPSMKLQIDSVYSHMIKLTEEQYEVLNSIEENKRIFVQGAAGTGKSILAIEKVRHELSK